MRNPHNDTLRADNKGHGKAGGENQPERRCVLTGQNACRDELIRLAISPEGLVLPDALARAPGRGAWILVNKAELEAAQASGKLKAALSRAFKDGAITIPENFSLLLENALARALVQRLGLEMRAGKLILGSDRIAEQARSGRVAWLGHASDAREDGNRKLDQAFRVGKEAEGSGLTGIVLPLDRAALSVALGRDNVVHLALSDRASAERVNIPLQRLLRFKGAAPEAAEHGGDRTTDAVDRQAVTTN